MPERRSYTAEFKAKVVLELLSGEKGLTQASREYQIKVTLLSHWRSEFLERASRVFASPQAAQADEAARLAELEQMVGRLTMELDAAKKVLGSSDSPDGKV